MRQIDFRFEAYNLARFSQNFRKEIRMNSNNKDTNIKVDFPRVSPRFLSESVRSVRSHFILLFCIKSHSNTGTRGDVGKRKVRLTCLQHHKQGDGKDEKQVE